MIQKYKKSWMTIIILIFSCLILNIVEFFLSKENISLRTFVQVGKGLFTWLLVPLLCAWFLYMMGREEWKEKKGLKIALTIFLIIAVIVILIIGFFRGFIYAFSTECKEEKKIEGNILEVKESDWDITTTSYYETILFFFRRPFQGYSDEALIRNIQDKYGADTEFTGMSDGLYHFTGHITEPVEADIDFQVKNDYLLTNDYGEEIKHYLGNTFFLGKNRSHSWSVTETEIGSKYFMLVDCNGRADLEWFCQDVTELIEYYLKNDVLRSENKVIDDLGAILNQESNAFYIGSYVKEYNATELYNYLYEEMEHWLNSDYISGLAMDDDSIQSPGDVSESLTEFDSQQEKEIAQEQIEYYLSMEPALTFTMDNGLEYRVLETDRACGSSYYSLVVTADGGKTAALVNPDPFNGNGGGARWITFLDDKLGFVGMCYSGGSLGMIFRTEDGGVSFTEIEYPSPQIALPDGTYYNPFIMPEKVYEQDGCLYMEAGQGPNGDYKGGDTACMGLYQSEDLGKTWTYIREIIQDIE